MTGHTKVLNPRQIVFAQAVAAGKTYADALRIAGSNASEKNIHKAASELARIPIVRAEIERLKVLAGEVQGLSADWWRREIVYQYTKVREAANATDALRALELAGKHLGMLESRDNDRDDAAARLLQNLTTLTALQLAAQATAKGPEIKTVDATIRETLGLPEHAPQDPPA